MFSCVVWEAWDFKWRERSLLARKAGCSDTSITISDNVNARHPSSLKPVSNDVASASVLLCDTAVCFSHAHQIGPECNQQICSAFDQTLALNLSNIQQHVRLGIRLSLHSLAFVSNMTQWSMIHRTFENTHQSRQPLVTRSVPHRDTSQGSHWPSDVWSTDWSEV